MCVCVCVSVCALTRRMASVSETGRTFVAKRVAVDEVNLLPLQFVCVRVLCV